MNRTKWFTSRKMTWGKVIALALATAVLTAGLNLIPALDDTSFQDIAINLDCWILFAVFIIVNCETWREASVKTFVFFLISQPLIYLIQVPFVSMGFAIFGYYRFWFKITVLTLPGAAVAFLVKRKDWLGTAVLSVAAGELGYMAAKYFWSVRSRFPHHLLSMCFCLLLAFFLVFTLLDKKAHRAAASAVIILSVLLSLTILKPDFTRTIDLGGAGWTCTEQDVSVVEIVWEEDGSVTLRARGDGNAILTFVNEEGEVQEYWVTVSGGGIYVNTMD